MSARRLSRLRPLLANCAADPMSRKKMMVQTYSTTALVAASSNVQSGWIDIGKQTPDTEVTRTATGGTYALEVDWSRDNGATTLSTDTTLTPADGATTVIIGKARWVRFRVRNTHAVTAFTAHDTTVKRDASFGR